MLLLLRLLLLLLILPAVKPRFDHEKLRAYQASLEFITWATKLDLKAAVKDQLDRASTSIPLNVAEANGKFAIKDRCRFLDFARGSALDCAACLDVLVAKRLTDVGTIIAGKERLVEIVSMLMGLISSVSSRVGAEPESYLFFEHREHEQQHE